jgi:hypothetical protein
MNKNGKMERNKEKLKIKRTGNKIYSTLERRKK